MRLDELSPRYQEISNMSNPPSYTVKTMINKQMLPVLTKQLYNNITSEHFI